MGLFHRPRCGRGRSVGSSELQSEEAECDAGCSAGARYDLPAVMLAAYHRKTGVRAHNRKEGFLSPQKAALEKGCTATSRKFRRT